MIEQMITQEKMLQLIYVDVQAIYYIVLAILVFIVVKEAMRITPSLMKWLDKKRQDVEEAEKEKEEKQEQQAKLYEAGLIDDPEK